MIEDCTVNGMACSNILVDNPEDFHDFPVALQLVGKHHQDEAVVKATQLIDEILKA